MNRRRWLAAAAAMVAANAHGISLPWRMSVKAKRKVLLIAGTSLMQKLNQALAQEFLSHRRNIDIVVEKGGSLPALIALKRGAIDIAAVDRDLAAEEDDLRTRACLIARGSVGFVVHPQSPVKALSNSQLRALFLGRVGNWKQVGGPDAPVHLISRTSGSKTRAFVEDVVLAGEDIGSTAWEAATAGEMAERVAADPYAIGYLALQDKQDAMKFSYVAVDGVEATTATILSGRYPYTQSLYLVTQAIKEGLAAEFVAFAQSRAGQDIVRRLNFIPVR